METRLSHGKIIFVFFLFTLITHHYAVIHAQTALKFCIDLSNMADSGYFKPGEDRIVLRGNFNNWSGYDYELLADESRKGHYCNLFTLDAPPGAKVEYKYTIITPEGREYWEVNPNPDNPGYGNRIVEMDGDEMVLPLASFDYGNEIRGRVMSLQQQLQDDFMQARKLLEDNHPALYDYTTKEDLDALFNDYYDKIGKDTESTDLYRYLSKILAYVGCGHTKLWIPGPYWDRFPDRFFPLQLSFLEENAFVKGYYGNVEAIPVGAEIIAINGTSMAEITEKLLEYESSDGFIQSFKYHAMDQRFPFKYALIFGFPENFEIIYQRPGSTEQVKATLEAAGRTSIEAIPLRGNELSFYEPEGKNTGVMTINSFGYYSEVPMFRAFIDSSFLVLKEKNIPNLIIDLRGNDGGDPWCASYLFSCLQKEPVPYFSEVYHHYEDLAKPLPMPENHYTGNVYVLIDGGCFSTTGHLLGLLKYHNLVRFVGTESGATYTCTGNVTYVPLNNTGFIMGTARESRYTAAVKGMDPKQGIIPDYYIPGTADDLAKGKDGQLQFVLELAGK